MKVTYLDLETGKTTTQDGINQFELTENDWSCDCNRLLAFNIDDEEDFGMCDGHYRIIVINVEPEGDEFFNVDEVRMQANLPYYKRLLSTKPRIE